MPKIPVYEQQLTPSTTGNMPRARGRGVEDTGQGLRAIGSALADLKQVQDRVDLAERERRLTSAKANAAEELTRLKGELLLDKDYDTQVERYQAGVQAIEQQARESLGDDDRLYQDWEQDFRLPALKSSYDIRRNVIDGKTGQFKAQLASDLDSYAAQVTGADPQLDEQYRNDGLAAIEQGLEAGYLSPEEAQRQRELFGETITRSRILYDLNRDPAKAIERLESGEYGQIEAGDREAWRYKAENLIEQERRRQQAAADRRLARAERAMSTLERTALTGYPVRPEDMQDVAEKVRGTELESQFQAFRQDMLAIESFAGKPPSEQAEIIEQSDAALRAGGASMSEITRLQRLASIHQTNLKSLQDDPLGYAATHGIAQEPQPLSLADPEAMQAQLADRLSVAQGLRKSHGAPVKVLRPDEAAQLSSALSSGTPESRKQLLGTLAAGIDDPQAYRATMAQLGDENTLMGAAGIAALDDEKTANLILRGSDILTNNTLKISDAGSEGFRAQFDDYLQDAAYDNPAARAATFETARAIYATLTMDAGAASEQYIDPARVEQATRMALGGDVIEYNGRHVVAPAEINESQFADRLSIALRQMESSGRLPQGVTADDLADLPLSDLADGKYLLRTGSGWALDAEGRPITIDIHDYRVPEPELSPYMRSLIEGGSKVPGL